MSNLIETVKEFISNILGNDRLSFDGWRCDFVDDFSTINKDIWSPCIKAKSNWNKFMSQEYPMLYKDIKDTGNGCIATTFLRLKCVPDYDKNEFITEGLTTKDKKLFNQGRIEVKARFKSGKTTWPAIWLVNKNNSNDEYYEIDVCEYFGTRNYVNVTYHCPSSMNKKRKPVYKTSSNFNKDDWNTFVCEWDEKAIKVYVNGKKSMTIKNDDNQTHYPVNIKDRFLFIILSMQYAYPGSVKPDVTELPLWMDIDYVKHWVKI